MLAIERPRLRRNQPHADAAQSPPPHQGPGLLVCDMLPEMDVIKMLAELRQERAQIEQAIMVLERLARGHGKRRGRPPAWMTAQVNVPKRRGRPPGSKNKPRAQAAA